MLNCLHELKQFKLEAQDGTIGRVKDFLFDEKHWTVRYMVADTGTWLPGRKVLISPVLLGTPDWERKRFEVKLTMEQVKGQPGLDTDAPVSRKHEKQWLSAYGFPYYWTGSDAWGYGAEPVSLLAGMLPGPMPPMHTAGKEQEGDPHLRSLEEIRSYKVASGNDTFGHVQDLVMEDETWKIRYVQIDTRKWLPGQTVLLYLDWFSQFDWTNETLGCELTRKTIENIPKLKQGMPITREHESLLHEHFEKPAYWWDSSAKVDSKEK